MECPICTESGDLDQLPCQHPMCRSCLEGMAKAGHGYCPLCRALIADADFLAIVGHHAMQNGAHTKAVTYFTEAAKMGHVGAMNNMGIMIVRGQGCNVAEDQRLFEAEPWFIRAAKGGSVESMRNLVTIYENGIWGRTPSYISANFWKKRIGGPDRDIYHELAMKEESILSRLQERRDALVARTRAKVAAKVRKMDWNRGKKRAAQAKKRLNLFVRGVYLNGGC